MMLSAFLMAAIVGLLDPQVPEVSDAFEGRWYGTVQMNDGRSLDTVIDSERLGQDWVLRITQLADNRSVQPIVEFKIENERVELATHMDGLIQFWSGAITDSGSTYAGTMTREGQQIGSFDLRKLPRVEDQPSHQIWAGSVIVPGRDFEDIRLYLAPVNGEWLAECDLPDRQCDGHPVFVRSDSSALLIEIPGPSPIQLKLITPQPLDADDAPDQVLAAWDEAGSTSTFMLQRKTTSDPVHLARPQDPVGPVSYESREEIIVHPIGHQLAATLTVPSGGDQYPAVVLVPGEGGRDRDDRANDHRYQTVWADALARRGIASLRFDDRGVGGSSIPDGMIRSDLTHKDVVIDTRHLVEWLSQQPGIDPTKVGVIGWDRGGLVAMQVAMGLHREISYVVLLSTPGLPGIDMARAAMRLDLDGVPVPQDRVRDLLVAYGVVLEVAADPAASSDEIREVVIRYREALSRMPDGQVDQISDDVIDQDMKLYASDAFRRIMRLDPRQILPRLRCPVLAVGGSADLETPIELTLPHIKAAVERTGGEVDVVEIPDTNHRLQPVDPRMPRRPEFIRATVDPRALRVVTDWILDLTSVRVMAEPVDSSQEGSP